VATNRQVEAKLRELVRRLDRADPDVQESLAETLPEPKIIEVKITDLDSVYWTQLQGGRMSAPHKGPPAEEADIRVRLSSDHLLELMDGERSLFASFVGGHVKIEASFSDLMRLRKLA
jgi:putative sterol carrier protein